MDSQQKMQREIAALKDRIVAVAEEKDAEIERLRRERDEARAGVTRLQGVVEMLKSGGAG
jgi:hypothetical protein